MKMINFQGDLSDNSAKMTSLMPTAGGMHGVEQHQAIASPSNVTHNALTPLPGGMVNPLAMQFVPHAFTPSMNPVFHQGVPVPVSYSPAAGMDHMQAQAVGLQQQQSFGLSDMSMDSSCQKKTRLVWTPELHKRFLFAVERIGLKVAVPRTILQVRLLALPVTSYHVCV